METNTIGLTAALPLQQTADALRAGSLDLIQHVHDRCDRIDVVESEVRALVPEPGRRDRLLREAAALLERHPDPARRPPLWGVLVGIKDIFAVDGFATRCGSALPPELFSMSEATSVGRLREAGALVLGKTVTTEFAFFDPGSTANPHNPQHTPGGSSSGSAAAVAAGYAPLALGTQTVGSISRPAAFCGVVGCKPSHGRIPTDGILPVSRSIDQAGLFTQDAAGASLAASVLCDGWRAPLGDAAPEHLPVLGVPEGPYLEQADRATREHFDTQLALLETRGYAVRRVLWRTSNRSRITTRRRRAGARGSSRSWRRRMARRAPPGPSPNDAPPDHARARKPSHLGSRSSPAAPAAARARAPPSG